MLVLQSFLNPDSSRIDIFGERLLQFTGRVTRGHGSLQG